ncbi:MAG: hypothetical protein D4S01_10430 [Dehalococcoidia bacterium]|nr:MAG: hypothetical protein D4S01_10430 [Dehalococcoidia bacterium]
MLIKDAKAITGGIGFTTKTGFSFGLQARTACKIGSKLCLKKGSTCFGCYAQGGNYAYPSVKTAHGKRLSGVMKLNKKAFRSQWVEAMHTLIENILKNKGQDKKTWYFRWHDSGDIINLDHFRSIVDVCLATPKVKHWIPTKEIPTIKKFIKAGGVIPKNLCVRLSNYYIDKVDDFNLDLPMSVVYSKGTDSGNAKICQAILQHKGCLEVGCRKCWDKNTKLVGYQQHR